MSPLSFLFAVIELTQCIEKGAEPSHCANQTQCIEKGVGPSHCANQTLGTTAQSIHYCFTIKHWQIEFIYNE